MARYMLREGVRNDREREQNRRVQRVHGREIGRPGHGEGGRSLLLRRPWLAQLRR